MKDRFSQHASQYAAFRPNYPQSLYDFILLHTLGRDIAWDCACGNGQVALDLAPHFKTVEATDEKQRARIWSGRKAAFAAMRKLAPDMICMDGTIPRHALPHVLEEMAKLSEQYGWGTDWPEIEKRAIAALAPNHIGRAGRPEDVAHAVMYLASPAGGFVTGTDMLVSGGPA